MASTVSSGSRGTVLVIPTVCPPGAAAGQRVDGPAGQQGNRLTGQQGPHRVRTTVPGRLSWSGEASGPPAHALHARRPALYRRHRPGRRDDRAARRRAGRPHLQVRVPHRGTYVNINNNPLDFKQFIKSVEKVQWKGVLYINNRNFTTQQYEEVEKRLPKITVFYNQKEE